MNQTYLAFESLKNTLNLNKFYTALQILAEKIHILSTLGKRIVTLYRKPNVIHIY